MQNNQFNIHQFLAHLLSAFIYYWRLSSNKGEPERINYFNNLHLNITKYHRFTEVIFPENSTMYHRSNKLYSNRGVNHKILLLSKF